MSMKLGLSSGSYNVRESEASRTSAPHTNKSTIICSVAFLDDTSVAFQINKKDKASILLQKCFDHLDLNEKDYFSLQFCDTNIPGGQVMRWIDPYKSIKKQMKGLALKFFFRVKFYLSDPTSLRDDYTRFQFVRQLRLDILTGRLSLLYHDAVLLSSYVVQSELGDYNSDDHTPGYLSSFKFVAQQTDKFLDDVCSLHSQHRSQTPADSELMFLDTARTLPMYGVHLYTAKLKEMLGNHGNNQEIQLGVTSAGLVIFQKNVKTSTFSWQKIIKITFKKKLFYIQLKKEPNEPFDTHSFVLFSYRTCKSLWRSCVEHHTFFRLSAPPLTHRSSLFSISASRFPGKTQLQVMEESKKRPFMERSFKRTSSCNNYTRRTISNPQRQSNNAGDNKHFTNCQNGVPVSSSYPTSLRRCADNFFQQGSTARATLPTDYKPTGEYGSVGRGQTAGGSALTSAVTSPSTTLDRPQRASLRGSARSAGKPHVQGAPAAAPTSSAPVDSGSLRRNRLPANRHPPAPIPAPTASTNQKPHPTMLPTSVNPVPAQRGRKDHQQAVAPALQPHAQGPPPLHPHNPPQSTENPAQPSPLLNTRAATNFDNRTSWFQSSPGHKETEQHTMGPITPVQAHGTLSGPSHSTPMPGHNGVDMQHQFKPNIHQNQYPVDNVDTAQVQTTNGTPNSSDLVSINITPDFQGRFGFNVKGGADQSMPVIVSRVAPNTPADNCVPRLNEGDQVLYINGRDISTHSHEQVVMFIKSSSQMHTGRLDLIVRPNAVYIGEECAVDREDDDLSDVAACDTSQNSGENCLVQDRLEASVDKMKRAIEDGTLLTKFEQLNRKKPGMANTVSQQYSNIIKNRYKDISPYDKTRVTIASSNGDYINANYVNMEIPGSGVVNRYIAAQGPLPNTCTDFWSMVWDQQCSIVVMLTTMVERGRVKCHQYWPDLYETQCYGSLHLTCVSERITDNFAFREFNVVNTAVANSEERHIKQMQYIAWPDHAVPADSSAFLEFVCIVRQARTGLVSPIIVHCSAGIGRTGVLITMETAMCLIEANQSIMPLDIVRKMRCQRAMLIQTTNQFKFVCEAVIKVYEEKSVTPLDDYRS